MAVDQVRGRAVLNARLALCAAIIAAGLVLRGFGPGLGLPAGLVKYGGSILWGAMVHTLVAITAHGVPRRTVAGTAMLIAVGVELFRLHHTPWLDSFRLTPAGALLLGRVFSPWNILAYGCGILLGAMLDPGSPGRTIRDPA